MTTQQVSRRQKRILRLLVAEHRRPQGGTSMSHYELVKALEGDKGNSSHSLRTLESAADEEGRLLPFQNRTSIFITPAATKDPPTIP